MNINKPNYFISRKQGSSLGQAWRHCSYYGFPLNTAFTVHFALAGLKGDYIEGRQKIIERLRKEILGKGLFPHDAIFSCLWAMENNHDGKDAHLHGAVHLPSNLDEDYLQDFLEGVVKGIDGAVLVKPVYDSGWLTYMLKGCHPDDYDYFNIPRSLRKKQGIIWGKRCGASQAIDATERNKRIARNKSLNQRFIPKVNQSNNPAIPPMKVSKTPFKCERKNAI